MFTTAQLNLIHFWYGAVLPFTELRDDAMCQHRKFAYKATTTRQEIDLSSFSHTYCSYSDV